MDEIRRLFENFSMSFGTVLFVNVSTDVIAADDAYECFDYLRGAGLNVVGVFHAADDDIQPFIRMTRCSANSRQSRMAYLPHLFLPLLSALTPIIHRAE